jgi:hypothetical protein
MYLYKVAAKDGKDYSVTTIQYEAYYNYTVGTINDYAWSNFSWSLYDNHQTTAWINLRQ